MRVTQGMISNNMLRNITGSYSKMDKYLEQLATGKKITLPSDDPVIATKGIGFRREVAGIEQYKRNTNEVNNWMDNSDAALDKTTKALQSLRELAVQASNGTYDKEERQNIAKEAEQLKEHLIDIGNTNVNGKYIFNGTNASEGDKPIIYEDGEVEIGSEGNKVMIEVAKGTKLQANVEPGSVFTEEMFEDIDKFIERLEDNDESIDDSIEVLDGAINDTINARADLGARMNRLELVENRLDEQEVISKATMSQNEDVDFEKAITNLITQETMHRAALSAGSRIIQPSLVDFLR